MGGYAREIGAKLERRKDFFLNDEMQLAPDERKIPKRREKGEKRELARREERQNYGTVKKWRKTRISERCGMQCNLCERHLSSVF